MIQSQEKSKGNNFVALQNLMAQEIMVALCLQEGRRLSLLAIGSLADLCTRGSLHDQTPWLVGIY